MTSQYRTDKLPVPLAESSKIRRREILQARIKRGESVVSKLLTEFESEGWVRVERRKTNEAGLVKGQDNLIFVKKTDFKDSWNVFKTATYSSTATSIFTFETEDDALWAGQKIADAIGGTFHGTTDPRK